MNLRDETDEHLMRYVRRGDERAFEVLYHRYSTRMLNYFFRMLGRDEEKAQDFLQELFTKVIEKAHLYQPERPFTTWLYTLASNMCKNEYRRLSVRRIMTTTDEFEHVADREPEMEWQLDQQAFSEQLTEVLAALSPAHREAFMLRYQQGLSIKEISQVANCAEGTVKSRIFYALRKLADSLAIFRELTQRV